MRPLRLYVPFRPTEGDETALPAGAVRHAQVRRVQPGDVVQLFDGSGLEWPAEVLAMGRSAVRVRPGASVAVSAELPIGVTLAVGMPANERMDTLVEKATELGAAAIAPLLCERAVLRLAGERAEKKRLHWQAVAVAASEQCGRAVVPAIGPVLTLADWLRDPAGPRADGADPAHPRVHHRWLASLRAGTPPLARAGAVTAGHTVVVLSGPEGGLTYDEESAALDAGFSAVHLGPRVLRADTAPLAVLAWLAAVAAGP